MKRYLSLVALVLMAACSTVHVMIPVMKPAEINVAKYKQVGVDHLRNDPGDTITGMLKSALVESNRFTVLDRENMGKVSQELNMAASAGADNSSGPQLGKQLTASALILGSVAESSYNERMDQYNYTTKDTQGRTYYHTTYTRKGQAVVSVNFQVTDVETGQLIKAKQLRFVAEDTSSATDNTPAEIDREGLLQQARQQVVKHFVTAITPHQVNMNVAFLKDGKLPQLEQAINMVKAGQYPDALKTVTEAIDLAEKSGLPAKAIAKAYWDRGLISEYSDQFEAARADVKKAYQYQNDEDYLAEIQNINTRERDEKKLLEQTGSKTGDAPAATAETGT